MEDVKQIFINKNAKLGILMLHGFSSTPRQFRELSAYLSEKGFNILAPIIAGHGTTPEDFMKSTSKDWTKSAMDAYLELKKISEKIIIIGNSFGSDLGLWLAKELNNEPLGIVTIGAPIFLRFHKLIKIRYFTYGRFRKYYKKPARLYKTDYTDMVDEVSYPILPVKSIKELIDFLEKETKSNLPKVKIPILIASATVDPVIHPNSVKYIFKNVGSSSKEVFWFDSIRHNIMGMGCDGLFCKIYDFIKKLNNS